MGEIFGDYYLNLIPFLFKFLSPLCVLISTIIVTASLAAHLEVTAILSSGVSFRRFLRPYFLGSLMAAGMIFYLVGWVIPASDKTKVEFEIKYLEKPHYFKGRDVHFRLDENTYAYLQSYSVERDVGYRFALETFEDGELKSKLTAHTLTWDSLKTNWRISAHTVRGFDSKGNESVKRYGSRDTTLNLYPKDFESHHGYFYTLTIPELKAYIDEQKVRGLENVSAYETEYHERLAYPYAIVLLTFLGVIVSSKKSREGMAMPIVIGVLIGVRYFLCLQLGRTLVVEGTMPPVLGAWLPNIGFSLLGFVVYLRMGRV